MSEELEYLTVEDMKWSQGFQRPRMSASERKEKHRIHQQQFMARKRQRVAELRAIEDRLKLQLRYLQTARTARKLVRENEDMRRRLAEIRAQPTSAEVKHEGDEDEELRVLIEFCRTLFYD